MNDPAMNDLNFDTLLIANRGEIACRIIRTAKRLGLNTIAVHSEADTNALHVRQADRAVCIGPTSPAESYLNIEAVLSAAVTSGAQAIHPGYGFLSENAAFAEACFKAGIVFVGPSAESMLAMGLKDAAKQRMFEAGVPIVPGYHGEDQSPDKLAREAGKVGYPVLIKARAGGGGKGMRLVEHPDAFAEALASARREAQMSFGDDAVLVEKFIQSPRHIEVQVFGDRHGQIVHLHERDCSLQRRHQKVLEEAPAPNMSEAVRKAMTTAAVTAAAAIDYVGAGTIEFIVDGSGPLRTDGFWFMEMNTRLQVEHPITEAITGVDLVEWQLRIAAGQVLPLKQEDIPLLGHAMEARLYAEDAAAGFLPAAGRLERLQFASSERVDTGVAEGDEVLPFYDPMLAKFIAHGSTREEARLRLVRQLADSVVLGTVTNRAFLWKLAQNRAFALGEVHTGLIEADLPSLIASDELMSNGVAVSDALLSLVALWRVASPAQAVATTSNHNARVSAAERLGLWQLWGEPQRSIQLEQAGELRRCLVKRVSSTRWQVNINDDRTLNLTPDSRWWAEGAGSVIIDGLKLLADCLMHGALSNGPVSVAPIMSVRLGPFSGQLNLEPEFEDGAAQSNDGALKAPMPGRIVQVLVSPGDVVEKGQVLLTLEAMKMEHTLLAAAEHRIREVAVSEGLQVSQGDELLTYET